MENVHKHVFNFFKDNSVITTLQPGFVPSKSTTNQLVVIYKCNTFCKALDDGKEVRAVFCDVPKPLIEFGTKAYYSNLILLESTVPCCNGLLTISETENNVLLYRRTHLTGVL